MPSHLSLSDNNPYATNQLIYTGIGRQAIMNKLNTMRLESVAYDTGVPLAEVIRDLSQKIKARDPAKKGINIIINNNAEAAPAPAPAGPGGATQIDPTTGLPVAAAPAAAAEAVDIGAYLVKLNMEDVGLHDLLDAICLVADHPIKYSILDYAVVFSAKGADQLSTRKFRVNPDTFFAGLEGVTETTFGSTGGGNSGGNNSGGNNSGNNNGGNNSGGNNSGGNNSGGNNSGGGSSGGGGTTIAIVDLTGGGGGGGGGGGNNNNGGGRGNNGGNNNGGNNNGGNNNGGNNNGGNNNGGNNNGGNNNGGGRGNSGGGGSSAGVAGNGGLSFINPRNDTSDVSSEVKAYFNTLGIDMTTPAGKSVVWNDKLGYLFVRATDQDLDTIEQAIQTLNQVAPQVHIKSRFIEVSQTDSRALGFDWYLGQFNMGSEVVGTGGSSPSLTVPVSAVNPLGAFPGNTASSIVSPSASDQLLTSGLRNSAPALFTTTGILTDPNFRMVLRALEQRSGVETLGEPEITTTSGRQTQMRASSIKNVITGFSFNNGTAAATTTTATTTATTVNPGASSISPTTQQVETGPILDVVPYVQADGFTIAMALIPSDTEFNGYDSISSGAIPGYNPGAALAGIANGTALPVALPLFTVRQVITTVNVWDNQTVVLGGLITSGIQTTKDKVPFIGDLPFVGRLFQSQSKTETKDNLMVFVTATIVDPAGNRVHSDDELPFAQATVPLQPAFPTQTQSVPADAGTAGK